MRITAVSTIFLVLASPAIAADVDVSALLLDQSGAPVQDCDKSDVDAKSPTYGRCEEFVTLTLGRLVAGAVDQIETGLKPDEIVLRGTLARRVREALKDGKPLTMSDDEMKLARDQIAKMRVVPSIVSQAYDMLAAKTK